MTLAIFLYIFWGFLGIFFIFNLLLLRHFLKFKYYGKLIPILTWIYFIGFLFIVLIIHFFILRVDWNVSLF